MVPLGPREVYGVAWQSVSSDDPDAVSEDRLRDIIGRLDVPALQEPLRKFIDWVAELHTFGPGFGAAYGRQCA